MMVNAQLWSEEVDMETTFDRPFTSTGTALFVVVPLPS